MATVQDKCRYVSLAELETHGQAARNRTTGSLDESSQKTSAKLPTMHGRSLAASKQSFGAGRRQKKGQLVEELAGVVPCTESNMHGRTERHKAEKRAPFLLFAENCQLMQSLWLGKAGNPEVQERPRGAVTWKKALCARVSKSGCGVKTTMEMGDPAWELPAPPPPARQPAKGLHLAVRDIT